MGSTQYQKITVRSGEHYFSVFCTEKNLQLRRDEVLRWVDRLARRVHWITYDTTMVSATTAEATEREHALFETRYPD